MAKKVLGRGLEALIPKKEKEEDKDYLYLPIEKIIVSSLQPRQEIDPQELEELASSIKEKGILQPILVRKKGDNYEIVAGHRRYFAAKSLGINSLPSIVRDLDDQEVLLFALVENLQRKDLNPIEEAHSFKRLNEEFGLTYEEIAKFIGKDKSFVANTLRLLKLPPEIQEAVRKGIINRSQARTLLGLKNTQEQMKLFYHIIKKAPSVRDLEEKVRRRKKETSPFIIDLEEKLKRSLGTKVKIFHRKNNSGKIFIEYYNLNDLERITNKLL